MSTQYPAIVAVGYNRPESMKRLLLSIEHASYPDDNISLIVSIDKSNVSEDIERIVKEIGWSHGTLRIIRYEEKQGLRKHILQCGDLSYEYGAVVILEDDLIVSKEYYNYLIKAIDFHNNEDKVCGFALYSHSWNGFANVPFHPVHNGYDVFWGQFSISWGQCWTKKQWHEFRLWYERNENKLKPYNKIPMSVEGWGEQSWGKYFAYYMVMHDKYYIIPYESLSSNCSEIGEHNRSVSAAYQTYLLDANFKNYIFPQESESIKYDIFCERKLKDDYLISGVYAKDICFNLNGLHRDNEGKEYVVSMRREDGKKCIAEYGVQLRPIEQNILYDIPGCGIFLMESRTDSRLLNDKQGPSIIRMKYDMHQPLWRNTMRLTIHLIMQRIKERIICFKEKKL